MNYDACRCCVSNFARKHQPHLEEDFLQGFDDIVSLLEKRRTSITPKMWSCLFAGFQEQLKKEEKWLDQKPEQSETSPTKS